MKVIDPTYIKLKDWADNLVGEFGNEGLPVLKDEKNWKVWASLVAGTGGFALLGVPAPLSNMPLAPKFNKWQDWARKVFYIVNYQPIKNTNNV